MIIGYKEKHEWRRGDIESISTCVISYVNSLLIIMTTHTLCIFEEMIDLVL